MLVYLLRHGHTAGNLERRYIGRTDEPLCDVGWTALNQTGSFTTISHVWVSPLIRARETARYLFPKAVQIINNDFKEMDFGDFEGRTANEMIDDINYQAWVESECQSTCPNGENLELLASRTCKAFAAVVQEALDYEEDHLVIVAHGGTIMAVMNRYTQRDQSALDWHVQPLQGYKAYLNEMTWSQEPILTKYEMLEIITL